MTGNAAAAFDRGFSEGIKPLPDMTIDQWADEYLVLAGKQARMKGQYRTSRTPYVREVMQKLSPQDPSTDICFMKGTQLGVTTVGIAWEGFTVHLNPGPIAVYLPTVTPSASNHSKFKLAPIIKATPVLRERIRSSRGKDARDTILSKDFPGGLLMLNGANSGNSFRHMTYRDIILEEIDEWPEDVGGQGDPVGLLDNRGDTYPDGKRFKISTPTISGRSNIEREFNNSDQRYYYVPCPHCRWMQRLTWDNIKFKKDARYNLMNEPMYKCEQCGVLIEEHHKTFMLEHGEWRAHKPGREKIGYHLSSLYSPLGWLSWTKIVKEFLEAKRERNKNKLKRWVNTRLAEPWKEDSEEIDEGFLIKRREEYEAEVPAGVGVLLATVDVQAAPARVEIEVKGFGVGAESWGIEHKVIHGEFKSRKLQADLDEYLFKRKFRHKGGAEMGIRIAGVDSGNDTVNVYRYIKPRQKRGIYAIKGDSGDREQEVWMSKQKDSGIWLFKISPNMIKDFIYSSLTLAEPGPSYFHFPKAYTEDYFNQLVGERVVIRGNKRKYEPKVNGQAVEALDLNVYAYAMYKVLNISDKEMEGRVARLNAGPDAAAPKPKSRVRRKGMTIDEIMGRK